MLRKCCFFLSLVFVTAPFVNNAYSQSFFPVDYQFTVGEAGDSLGQFYRPAALTVDPTGNIYVADTGNNRIQKFDRKGNFVAYIGGLGSGREQFDMPTDIFTPEGLNVYVTDYNNHRIHQLDRHLNAIAIFTGESPQTADYQFSFPNSIAISAQGDQFLIEAEKNSVIKFDSFFTPIVRFGGIETGEGVLNGPEKIDIIGNQYVCVTDGQAGRIVVFDYFGNFIRFLGEDTLAHPAGLSYWRKQERLLVSDLSGNSIYAFSLQGDFLKLKSLQKGDKMGWRSPVDIAIHEKRLYVLDQDQQRILVYRIVSFPE